DRGRFDFCCRVRSPGKYYAGRALPEESSVCTPASRGQGLTVHTAAGRYRQLGQSNRQSPLSKIRGAFHVAGSDELLDAALHPAFKFEIQGREPCPQPVVEDGGIFARRQRYSIRPEQPQILPRLDVGGRMAV